MTIESKKNFDAIILGLGTMGCATALELSRVKASVIGFDQFRPPHGMGSHGGQTRVFRIGYAESPKYVPLVQRAGILWDDLSAELRTTIVTRCGLLTMGLPHSAAIQGIQRCIDQQQLDIDQLTPEEIRYRYPAFPVPDDFTGLLERSAGWIDVDAAIRGMHQVASDLGAELCLDEPVLSWEGHGTHVSVRTTKRLVQARRLIVTAGAWTTPILRDLGLPIRIVRKTFIWFDPLRKEAFAEGAIPIFGFPPNSFYGFPNIRGEGVKVAEHGGGQPVAQPDHVAPADENDYSSILETASRFLPGLAGGAPGDARRILKSSTCLYSMTPDEHFILDVHPEHPNVVFAAGFSGHGFKFAPVIGEVMADLALEGKTSLPVEFLKWKGRQENGRS